MSKQCCRCKNVKENSEFTKRTASMDGLHYYCKICSNAKNKKWRDLNPEKSRELVRKSTKKHYKKNHARVMQQKRMHARKKAGCVNPTGETNKFGVCPICNTLKKLVYDHDHLTGVFRGWLCVRCNLALGTYEKYKVKMEEYLGYSSAIIAR